VDTSVAEPELHHFGGARIGAQRDAAPVPLVSAPNLMLNRGGLSEMSLTETVPYFPIYFYNNLNNKKSKEKELMFKNTLVGEV
jgi:hypothetical protein